MDSNQKKIANIHDFNLNFEIMADRLNNLKDKYQSGLIIPIVGNDINSPGLPKMVEGVNHCDYLSKVLIALSVDDLKGYNEALRLSKSFKVPCEVVWCNKPEVGSVLEDLKHKGHRRNYVIR